jgi:hypothetical protein
MIQKNKKETEARNKQGGWEQYAEWSKVADPVTFTPLKKEYKVPDGI